MSEPLNNEASFTPADDSAFEQILADNARAGQCPPPALLFAAEEDVLPAADGLAIRTHAATCLPCQTLLAGLAPSDASLTPGQTLRIHDRIANAVESQRPQPITAPRPSFWSNLIPVAAVLILSLGTLVIYRWMHHAPAATIATNTPIVAAPAPAAPAPLQLAELHQLAPLAPPDDAAILTTRGAHTASPTTADLLPAFRAYNRGDFTAAAAAFVPVAARFPKADLPALYLGVSQLQLGDNIAAQSVLTHAFDIATPTRKTDAAWYLAIADLRLNQVAPAKPLLTEVCAATASPHSARACELSTQLSTRN